MAKYGNRAQASQRPLGCQTRSGHNRELHPFLASVLASAWPEATPPRSQAGVAGVAALILSSSLILLSSRVFFLLFFFFSLLSFFFCLPWCQPPYLTAH